jgi:hypothetical protein
MLEAAKPLGGMSSVERLSLFLRGYNSHLTFDLININPSIA